jgi:hypothetical protein
VHARSGLRLNLDAVCTHDHGGSRDGGSVHLGQGELSRLGTRSDQVRVRLTGVSRIKPFAVEDGERAFRISEFCCMLIRSGRSNKICGFHWRENF